MEKIICDVCGIAYPETAAQCPICGCARTVNGQTSACDTVQPEEEITYTATKGGRFSKSNVRKRLKAAQIQPVPLEIPARAPKVEEPEPEDEDDYEDYDEDDDDEMPATNRGLIAVVVLLLLAIIAVGSYIAIVQFGIFDTNTTRPTKDPGASNVTTVPTDISGTRIPCTELELADSELTLGGAVLTMQLSYSINPVDTTDDLVFTSSDPTVATVDKNGNVTAVGDGQATITITCGDISKTCKVTCVLNPKEPEQPDEPEVPEEPMPDLQLRMTDASFNAKGYQWRAYKETNDFGADEAAKFTWKMDDETIATVNNGIVTVLAPGRTTLRVYYGYDQVATCVIRCNWTDSTEPETPSNPETPDTPDTPAADYQLKIDNSKPVYQYNGQANSADVSMKVGGKFKLTIVDTELEQIMNDVVWVISDESICQVNGTTVTGLSKGTCRITAEYKGVTFLVFVRVSE